MKALITLFIADYLREMEGNRGVLSRYFPHRPIGEHLATLGALAVFSLGFVVIAGCGGAYDSSAHGVVTLDGKVVPRGTVSFHPVAGGPAAYAMIGDDGSYSIRTGRQEGLPSGDYLVSVTANEAAAVAQTDKGGPPPPGKPSMSPRGHV